MVIESRLNKAQLTRYRHWKQDIRISIRQTTQIANLIKEDGNLKRLFDKDFFPLFIGGVAGSGTTLLGALLNQNYRNRLNFIGSERTLETSRVMWREKGSSYNSFEDYVADLLSPTKRSAVRVRAAVLGLYRRSATYPYSSPIVIDKNGNSRLLRIGILRKAFPRSGVILIYRDPVEVIEGLRRKWPKLYQSLNIDELCEFWNFLHTRFLEETNFDNDLIVISYKGLVDHSLKILESLSKKYALSPRGNKKNYKDTGNKPGKGLRNVKKGKIRIVKNAYDSVSKTISKEEVEIIRRDTRDMFSKLEKMNSFASPSTQGRK